MSNTDLKMNKEFFIKMKMPTNTTGTLPTPKTMKPKKQLKKLKDPEAPRRPLSPYMLFVTEERTKVVADMGSMVAIGEVGKEMGRRWGLMDQQEKLKYEDAYKKDKARYEEEMKTYQPSQQFLDRKVRHDDMKAEIAMGTYFAYLQSNWRKIVSENPGLSAKEVQEITWTQWSKDKMVGGGVKLKVKIVGPDAPMKLFTEEVEEEGLAANAKGLAEMWKNMEEEGKRLLMRKR